MTQEWTFDPSGEGRSSNLPCIRAVRYQAGAAQGYPLAGVVLCFGGEPLHFLSPVKTGRVLRQGLVVEGEAYALVFGQGHRFERTKDSVFVDRVEPSDHGIPIV